MRFFLTLASLSLLIFCSSCSEVFSPTNHHQIVRPDKKGSLQLTGGFSDRYVQKEVQAYPAPLERYAYGVQIGYSPIERLGIIANFYRPNYSLRPTGETVFPGGGGIVIGNADTINAYFGYLADAAVGYYWKKETRGTYLEGKNKKLFNQTNNWLFDVYAGGGKGHLSTNYSIRGNKEISFNLFYIQGGLHWKNGIIGIDLVEKIIGTDFKTFHFIGNIFKDDLELAQSLVAKPFRFASRTSVRFSLGPDFGQIYIEGNMAHFSNGIERFYFNNNRINIGVLLELDACFRRLKRNKK